MRLTTITALAAASSVLLVAACATPVTEPQTAASSQQPSERNNGAQTQHLSAKSVATVDATPRKGKEAQALNAPAGRSIYFDLDEYNVKTEYRGIVDAHGKYLRIHPEGRIVVEGHADERGSREYNLALGQRRAEEVKKMLILLGAKEDQIESTSAGEEKPQAQGHNEQAWAKNRRGEIRYSRER